ncbi:MAG: BON domain-containing protein [Candidatus Heimdallarchaeota archaeon]|nr:BON domain-containing protein [Candidatus Heimdallarchaeota archaeon]
MTNSNEEIRKKINEHLAWDYRIEASNIEVSVDEKGKVILKGSVPTYSARKAALQDVWTIEGVTLLDNQLKVKMPTGFTKPSDEEIESNIRTILAKNRDIDEENIKVSANNGAVILKGTVDAYWKTIQAETLVSETSGVIGILNELTVVPTKDVKDQRIAEGIMGAIERTIFIDPTEIDVKVEEGNVSITGTVPHWQAYLAVDDAAMFTEGVKSVENKLEIRFPT